MPNSNGPQDVEVTPRLGEALRDYADVTVSITADAPPDRLGPALRRIRDALWEVGSTTPLPTGDLPTPVKYFNPDIRTAYQTIETIANRKLLDMVPVELQEDYRALFLGEDADREHRDLVKAADRLAAYIKCLEELAAGNHEFSKAEKALRASVEALPLPEVRYFLDTFVPSFKLTLDELG